MSINCSLLYRQGDQIPLLYVYYHMDLQAFNNLYVLQWNPVTDRYWCGMVTEALTIGAHNYQQRKAILSLRDKTEPESIKVKDGLSWIWVAVADDPDELWNAVKELKSNGRHPQRHRARKYQGITLMPDDFMSH